MSKNLSDTLKTTIIISVLAALISFSCLGGCTGKNSIPDKEIQFTPSVIANPTSIATLAQPVGIRKTDPPVKPQFSSLTPGPNTRENYSPFYRRATTFGTIIESGYSVQPSSFLIVNQWFAKYADKQIVAFAGAVISDPSQGGKSLEKPWPGIVILDIRDLKGIPLPGSGRYLTPGNHGALRILSADQSKLHVISSKDTLYDFDLNSLTFTEITNRQGLTQTLTGGRLVESSQAPFSSSEYEFTNYWFTSVGKNRLSLYAGSLSQDRFTGVILKVVSDPTGREIESSLYQTPITGAARIVDARENQLILVTVSGVVLTFDIFTGEFTTIDGQLNALPSKSANTTTTPPLAIVTFTENILSFECLNQSKCIPPINLTGYLPKNQNYDLGPIFYADPSNIFGIFRSHNSEPPQVYIIDFDPQQGKVASLKLDPTYRYENFRVSKNHIIYFSPDQQKIFIAAPDLKTRSIDVGFRVWKMVVIDDGVVMAIDEKPKLVDGKTFISFLTLDIQSGKISKTSVSIPLHLRDAQPYIPSEKYLITIEGIHPVKNILTCLYIVGSEPQTMRLGTFDLETGQEIASTADQSLIRFSTGYAQYKDKIYTYNPGLGEASIGASLIDMTTLKSLLDFQMHPEWKMKLVILPFGEKFLMGASRFLYLISMNGSEIQEFPLPEKWLKKEYHLMYYAP
jgi:hypothetical protein